MTKDQKTLVFLLLILAVLGAAAGWILLAPGAGASTGGTTSADASTPYGESLSIKLGGGSSTSKASVIDDVAAWLASYQDGDSQDVYTVNGTYKEQELVTLSYTLAVTYSNVESITATVKIKAIDQADSSSYEYTLANAKSLSGASPINDNGQTQKSISAHLTDAGASTSGATIKYQIYCQVTGTGTVSGETLTATVPYTQFGKLVYLKSSENSSAEITPTVSVARWVASVIDEQLGLPGEFTLSVLAVTVVSLAIIYAWREHRR